MEVYLFFLGPNQNIIYNKLKATYSGDKFKPLMISALFRFCNSCVAILARGAQTRIKFFGARAHRNHRASLLG